MESRLSCHTTTKTIIFSFYHHIVVAYYSKARNLSRGNTLNLTEANLSVDQLKTTTMSISYSFKIFIFLNIVEFIVNLWYMDYFDIWSLQNKNTLSYVQLHYSSEITKMAQYYQLHNQIEDSFIYVSFIQLV